MAGLDGEEDGGFLELLTSVNGGDEENFLLCFGGGGVCGGVHPPPQVSSDSSLSSLSPSSPPTNSFMATISKPSKKEASGGGGREKKKARTEGSAASVPGTTRVRKEKIGERIMALQQLVSPFGKTDTASVLYEAMGYIRFLHDQVQVLSSPYLQRLPNSATLHEGGGGGGGGDLRSRGLCLVPVTCTEHVANSNGADIWSPCSMAPNNTSKN